MVTRWGLFLKASRTMRRGPLRTGAHLVRFAIGVRVPSLRFLSARSDFGQWRSATGCAPVREAICAVLRDSVWCPSPHHYFSSYIHVITIFACADILLPSTRNSVHGPLAYACSSSSLSAPIRTIILAPMGSTLTRISTSRTAGRGGGRGDE
ncbi:hypothetical protein C8R47DRAFT_752284 [Mycena vitilis]|nr:hypothetical protein C8R47DRAFT_752284 [Mycena vitilis]